VTRRPLGPGMTPRPASRMAPGGRMWSESPVRRPLPRVRQMGVDPCIRVPPPYLEAAGWNGVESVLYPDALALLTHATTGNYISVMSAPFTATVTLQDTTATSMNIVFISFGGFDPVELPGTSLDDGIWTADFPACPTTPMSRLGAPVTPGGSDWLALADVWICPT
jgi:hypothetical protein